MTSFLLSTFLTSHAGIVSSFFHSLSTAAFASRISPNQPQTCDLLCFLETSTGALITTGALSLYILLAKFHAALRAYSSCREVSSGVLSSDFGAQGFRSWGSPFWITSRDGLFLSRIWTSHQVRPGNFIACSNRSVQSHLPRFPQKRLPWIWILRYTTLDLFFLSESQLLLEYSHFSTSC